jgi:hypothetical protein
MTPSGIEPGTFRLAAQCLNHCATISGPLSKNAKIKIHRAITSPVFYMYVNLASHTEGRKRAEGFQE